MDTFKKTSFWGIISNDRIEIPVIQRDYAQGRKSKKVKQIREKFVDDLVRSLDTGDAKSRALHLDFVYGRIYGKDQELEMNDAERLLRIDEVYGNMLENYKFSKAFTDQIKAVALYRTQQQREVDRSRELNLIPQP